jgi:protein phosphatase
MTIANRRVYELGGATRHGRPGSTAVAILVHSEGAEIAHVGDSRCYLIHGSQIFQLTKDHSIVQKLVDAQLLTPAEAAAHPEANRILRALGSAPDIDVEVRAHTTPYVAGDAFVLCSDGLSDLVEPREILELATSGPALQAVGQLVDLANARGGSDNISVMILRTQESAGGARESVSPTVAQTLLEIPAPSSLRAPSSQNRVDAVSASHPAMAASPPLAVVIPSAPPLPRRPPRRLPSPAVMLGVVLAMVGVLAGAFALYLVMNPDRSAKQVAPFALSTLPPARARPLAPAPRESLSVAPVPLHEAEAGAPPPTPLPSLVPSPRSPRERHGS